VTPNLGGTKWMVLTLVNSVFWSTVTGIEETLEKILLRIKNKGFIR